MTATNQGVASQAALMNKNLLSNSSIKTLLTTTTPQVIRVDLRPAREGKPAKNSVAMSAANNSVVAWLTSAAKGGNARGDPRPIDPDSVSYLMGVRPQYKIGADGDPIVQGDRYVVEGEDLVNVGVAVVFNDDSDEDQKKLVLKDLERKLLSLGVQPFEEDDPLYIITGAQFLEQPEAYHAVFPDEPRRTREEKFTSSEWKKQVANIEDFIRDLRHSDVSGSKGGSSAAKAAKSVKIEDVIENYMNSKATNPKLAVQLKSGKSGLSGQMAINTGAGANSSTWSRAARDAANRNNYKSAGGRSQIAQGLFNYGGLLSASVEDVHKFLTEYGNAGTNTPAMREFLQGVQTAYTRRMNGLQKSPVASPR